MMAAMLDRAGFKRTLLTDRDPPLLRLTPRREPVEAQRETLRGGAMNGT